MLFLLVLAYGAWFSLKDLDRSVTEYILTVNDVYERAALENNIYVLLRSKLELCRTLLAKGEVSLPQCSALVNAELTALLLSKDINVSPPVIQPVLKPDLRFVFVKDVEGWIGRARFYIPAGAEVGP